MAVWETLATMGESVVNILSVFHYEVGDTPLYWEDKIQYSLGTVALESAMSS